MQLLGTDRRRVRSDSQPNHVLPAMNYGPLMPYPTPSRAPKTLIFYFTLRKFAV